MKIVMAQPTTFYKPSLKEKSSEHEICDETEKFMYSYRQAKEMVTKLKFVRRNSGTGKMHIYKCEHCKCWHLSSKGRFDHYHDDLMEIRNRQLKEIYAA